MERIPGLVTVRRSVLLPILGGNIIARIFSFNGLANDLEHVALQIGPQDVDGVPLVRLHSECLTGDVFGSQRCDCGPQLTESIYAVNQCGGYVLYLRQEGRGIGLYSKLDAYALQQLGQDTFQANRSLNFKDDLRDYQCAAEMLLALNVSAIRLLTNNPDKVFQLEKHGVAVIRRVSTGVYLNSHNRAYLLAKVLHARHDIHLNCSFGTDERRSL